VVSIEKVLYVTFETLSLILPSMVERQNPFVPTYRNTISTAAYLQKSVRLRMMLPVCEVFTHAAVAPKASKGLATMPKDTVMRNAQTKAVITPSF
jgi:hypothetical protein